MFEVQDTGSFHQTSFYTVSETERNLAPFHEAFSPMLASKFPEDSLKLALGQIGERTDDAYFHFTNQQWSPNKAVNPSQIFTKRRGAKPRILLSQERKRCIRRMQSSISQYSYQTSTNLATSLPGGFYDKDNSSLGWNAVNQNGQDASSQDTGIINGNYLKTAVFEGSKCATVFQMDAFQQKGVYSNIFVPVPPSNQVMSEPPSFCNMMSFPNANGQAGESNNRRNGAPTPVFVGIPSTPVQFTTIEKTAFATATNYAHLRSNQQANDSMAFYTCINPYAYSAKGDFCQNNIHKDEKNAEKEESLLIPAKKIKTEPPEVKPKTSRSSDRARERAINDRIKALIDLLPYEVCKATRPLRHTILAKAAEYIVTMQEDIKILKQRLFPSKPHGFAAPSFPGGLCYSGNINSSIRIDQSPKEYADHANSLRKGMFRKKLDESSGHLTPDGSMKKKKETINRHYRIANAQPTEIREANSCMPDLNKLKSHADLTSLHQKPRRDLDILRDDIRNHSCAANLSSLAKESQNLPCEFCSSAARKDKHAIVSNGCNTCNSKTEAVSFNVEEIANLKRPMNPFILYSKENRSRILAAHPDLDNRAISKILGNQWNSLPFEQKEVYRGIYRLRFQELKERFPSWNFGSYKNRHTFKKGNKKSRTKAADSAGAKSTKRKGENIPIAIKPQIKVHKTEVGSSYCHQEAIKQWSSWLHGGPYFSTTFSRK